MLLTIIVFILVLGLLVFVHELGHFVAAKKSGVRVFEFGFGIPPRIFGLQKSDKPGKKWQVVWGSKSLEEEAENNPEANKNTVYSINWLPLGGFVRLKGESGENVRDDDSLAHKSGWSRAWVLSAGVLMNALLCVVLISIGFMVGLPQAVQDLPADAEIRDRKIQIIQVLEGTPAEEAGLMIGDTLKTLDGQGFENIEMIQKYVDGKTDQPVSLTIIREQQEVTKDITPIRLEETDSGGFGVGLVETGIVSYPVLMSILKGVVTTGELVREIIFAFGGIIKDLVTVQKVTVDVAGPVGIAVLTGQVARMGFIYLLQFTALLSINLAIINALPIPALDGGHLLFLAIEKIRKKPLNQKLAAIMNSAFLMLLILLILVVTVKDVSRFSDKFSGLWQQIKNIF